MAKVRVCDVDDMECGEMRAVHANGRRLLLIRAKDGRYYAMKGICSHQGVDLSTGTLTGRIYAPAVGTYGFRDDVGEIVRCPRHGYEYDVKTGEARFDSAIRLRTYEVSIDRSHVVVDV